MSASITRPTFDKARRQAVVQDLYATGMSLPKISKRVGVSIGTVTSDVQEIAEFWEAETQKSVGRQVAREVAKLNRVEVEAWRAWFRTRNSGKGDPRYLKLILNIVDQRVKLLGLEAPKRQSVRDSAAQQPEWVEQIDRLAAGELAELGPDAIGRAFSAALESPETLHAERRPDDGGPGEVES